MVPRLRRALLVTGLVTPSGALSPGPLSISAIIAGASLGYAGGLIVAMGHLAVEAPYVWALLSFYSRLEEKLERYRVFLDASVVALLAYFSYLLLRDGANLALGRRLTLASGDGLITAWEALAAGIILTGGNVYFLMWWVSVGKPVIDEMKRLDRKGRVIVYLFHYSFDLAWLAALAYTGGYLVEAGSRILGYIFIGLGVVLLYFMVSTIRGMASRE